MFEESYFIGSTTKYFWWIDTSQDLNGNVATDSELIYCEKVKGLLLTFIVLLI